MNRRYGAIRTLFHWIQKATKWLLSWSNIQQRKRLKTCETAIHGSNSRTKCHGLAKSTGKQCRNWATNGTNYCCCHSQLQCTSSWRISRNEEKFVNSAVQVLLSGWVRVQQVCHQYVQPTAKTIPRSKAIDHRNHLWSTNTSRKKKRYNFRLDEMHQNIRTDTSQFRIANIHKSKAVAVWDYRQHKDAYTGINKQQMIRNQCCTNNMQQSQTQQVDLDHVLELHVVRDAYDRVVPRGVGCKRKKDSLKQTLILLLNRPSNLNFTTSDINQIKFRGVYNFQRDFERSNIRSLSGDDDTTGLVHYLNMANFQSKRLNRKTTARIQDEIVRSYDSISDDLLSEDPLQGQLQDQLHKNLTAMRLV